MLASIVSSVLLVPLEHTRLWSVTEHSDTASHLGASQIVYARPRRGPQAYWTEAYWAVGVGSAADRSKVDCVHDCNQPVRTTTPHAGPDKAGSELAVMRFG